MVAVCTNQKKEIETADHVKDLFAAPPTDNGSEADRDATNRNERALAKSGIREETPHKERTTHEAVVLAANRVRVAAAVSATNDRDGGASETAKGR